MDGGEVLIDGAHLGERFSARLGVPTGPDWVRAAELFGAGLPDAVAAVGAARGTASPAVAGVLLLDGYAQRVVAPVLAALHVEHRVLDARLALVSVQQREGRLHGVAFARPAVPVTDDREARTRVRAGLLAGHLDPVVDAVHAHTRAGRRVLHGTVANAVANTFLHLSWPRDDRAHHVASAREFLTAAPTLAGLVNVAEVVEGGEEWMYTDRNTCCLAFRTTVNQARDEPYCATCPIVPRARTRTMFAEATASYARRHPRSSEP